MAQVEEEPAFVAENNDVEEEVEESEEEESEEEDSDDDGECPCLARLPLIAWMMRPGVFVICELGICMPLEAIS